MNPSTHILNRIGMGLAVTGTALLLAASPASADSIAYVKGGDLWLSTPDGSRQYQVTSDGGYSAVSQADSGRMVGLRGNRLRYLEPDGTQIADIATPVSDPGDGSKQFYGPFDPALSHDGTKVAYDYYFQYTGYDPYCNPSNGCYTKQLYQGTGFTRPYELTGWDETGFKRQSGWVDPSWTGDGNEVMISNPSQPLNEDVVLYSPGDYVGTGGGDGNFLRWFDDPTADLSDGEMTRDETKIAFVDNDGERITVWRGKGGYPQVPDGCYALAGKGKLSSPSWSHDGARLAWAESDGVHTIAIPDLHQDCGTPTEPESKLVIPGATNPDWGPADVPPARPVPQEPTPGDGGAKPGPGDGGAKPGPGATGQPAAPPTGAPVTTIAPRPGDPGDPGVTPTHRPASSRPTASVSRTKLRRALAKGLTVRIAGATPGRHRLALKLGRRTVGGATAAIAPDGTGRTVVRFTAAGKRSLERRAKVSLILKGAGLTRKLTLRR